MHRTLAEIRRDPVAAREVIEAVFGRTTGAAKEAYVNFLASAVEYLSLRHQDRWGSTLFEWGVRLNVGQVECLVLHSEGLRILVEKESAPAATTWDGISYDLAPGCEMTTLPLPELPHALTSFAASHHAALSIAAAMRRPCGPIKNAHSVGIMAFLSQALHRPIPNPAYVTSAVPIALELFGDESATQTYSEGGRSAVLVNRFERDHLARKECISHYGERCSVCGMSFNERYGETMKGFIHVHHLIPLSNIGATYQVDPIIDLRPVCPNCHAVIHSVEPPMSIELARALISI